MRSLLLLVALGVAQLLPHATAQTTPADPPAASTRIDARPFPREFTVQGTRFNVHQPQYESWSGNQLRGRFAMAVRTGTRNGPDGKAQDTYDYGVVHFQARTQIDTGARAVVLTDLRLTEAQFPTAAAQQARYLELARQQLKQRATLTVSLDQLEAALAIAAVDARAPASLPVRNDPPEILFSTEPAVLLLVDGEPALRPTGSAGVQRAINTRSLLLHRDGRYYTALGGQWASALTLAGPWVTATADAALTAARREAVAAGQADAFDEPPEELRATLAAGRLPAIYVRTRPAELIAVQGDPQFVAIPGTQLSYIDNTGADVFVDGAADNAWYVLVSGRWFTAPGSKGPWTYVAPRALPAGFAKVPPDHPKSGVLTSIPGTPEARESLIANNIPQTATVDRTRARLDVQYDGAPSFAPVEGTALEYARNTRVPVIKVASDRYYAVDKGVWFAATAPAGPWQVATEVPAEIYAIPTSSPLHYVTYVRVYGTSANEVYVGYTPGYYGTVVSDDVVVYGTGYPCDPWVQDYWYGCPATYGMGVYFGWNPWVGWSFGWGWGWYDGWYGPYYPWWGPWYGAGWWGGGAAAWNVYGQWGNASVRGTAAAWANPWTGNVGSAARGGFYNQATGGRGVGRAGVNTNVYTGTTRAGAQGIRYNPQTGRVVAGGGAVAANPYTGQAVAGGQRTVVNTETGRVTQQAGGVVAGPEGAAGARAFDSEGNRVDARGVGGFHYNADTGTLHKGGVVEVNDDVYAGRDGNVYRYNEGQWEQVTRPERGTPPGGAPSDLDRDRAARERGDQRIQGGGFDRGSSRSSSRPSGGYSRPAGGFRPSMGGGMRGGGMRGGGRRR